jgi:hypothetical protein
MYVCMYVCVCIYVCVCTHMEREFLNPLSKVLRTRSVLNFGIIFRSWNIFIYIIRCLKDGTQI